ncbi:hypothetical protein KY084_05490 [Stakelama sp. CBK3Z-3]|uniref:ZIP family metal transporter n=1 Tax=Stakelama flava TaxID=2860338 RepID=A0ABS6XJF0_9SPHN|nr:hypothetical protein [Stakelama flava]MBW4330325.1 hypothetical protein [Stakelama flava]
MHFLLPVGFGILSGLSILAGGVIARAMLDRRTLLLSLSSGAILAIALIALLPEAVELSAGVWAGPTAFIIAALGYAGYLMLDRATAANSDILGRHLGPASFFLHALIDGLMAGIGFSLSFDTGLLMACAAIVHGLAHGINTVSLVTRRAGTAALARRWLGANAIAPVIGATLASFIVLSQPALAALVAIFAGIFLFIATSELMPSPREQSPAGSALLVSAILAIALVRTTFGGH